MDVAGRIVKAILIVSASCALWFVPTGSVTKADEPRPAQVGNAPSEVGNASAEKAEVGSSPGSQAGEPGRKSSIAGTVVDQSGQPLANAAVYLRSVGSITSPNRTEWTDDGGRFQFQGLAAGVFNVLVRVPTHYMESPDDRLTYVRAGESIKIRMIKGGILTGKVTGPSGEALIAAAVKPTRVRDQEGSPSKTGAGVREFQTDDRGMYRIYGLPPGSYIVSVGGGRSYAQQKPYDLNAPTYFPSSTRDTAAEVVVSAGQETSGIDIRYRDEPGYRVSGTISGDTGSSSTLPAATGLSLTNMKSGFVESTAFVSPNNPNRAFIFYGVPDGEYDLTATRGGGREDGFGSSPLRIKVKGSDVTGLSLTLTPLGKISGHLMLDTVPDGLKKDETRAADPPVSDTLIIARREGKAVPTLPATVTTAPDDQSKFTIGNLAAATYRFEIGLPSEDWYVREMAMAKSDKPVNRSAGRVAAASTGPDIAARGLALKPGEHVDGLSFSIGRGAAHLSGTVIPAAEGASLLPHMRLCLVPAEPERAADVLSYKQTVIGGDGKFVIANIPPGKYRAVVVPGPVDDSPEARATQLAWDPVARKQLRQRAESEGVELELAPRKRLKDFVLKVAPQPAGPRSGL